MAGFPRQFPLSYYLLQTASILSNNAAVVDEALLDRVVAIMNQLLDIRNIQHSLTAIFMLIATVLAFNTWILSTQVGCTVALCISVSMGMFSLSYTANAIDSLFMLTAPACSISNACMEVLKLGFSLIAYGTHTGFEFENLPENMPVLAYSIAYLAVIYLFTTFLCPHLSTIITFGMTAVPLVSASVRASLVGAFCSLDDIYTTHLPRSEWRRMCQGGPPLSHIHVVSTVFLIYFVVSTIVLLMSCENFRLEEGFTLNRSLILDKLPPIPKQDFLRRWQVRTCVCAFILCTSVFALPFAPAIEECNPHNSCCPSMLKDVELGYLNLAAFRECVVKVHRAVMQANATDILKRATVVDTAWTVWTFPGVFYYEIFNHRSITRETHTNQTSGLYESFYDAWAVNDTAVRECGNDIPDACVKYFTTTRTPKQLTKLRNLQLWNRCVAYATFW